MTGGFAVAARSLTAYPDHGAGQSSKMKPFYEAFASWFRELFEKKNMAMLYIFIDRYQNSSIKELASFARGLNNDIAAVENAVASPLSNGFVEGTNSKVKTIKKTMYGKCGIKLLSAKLMYARGT